MRGKPRFPFHVLVILCLGTIVLHSACSRTLDRSTRDPRHSPHGGTEPTPDQTKTAEAHLLASLKAAEALGEGNPLLMSNLYSLANFYRQQGNYDKAEAQYQRALALKERMAGPRHPDVATILYKYAALLREANRHHEADNLVARANAIMAAQQRRGP